MKVTRELRDVSLNEARRESGAHKLVRIGRERLDVAAEAVKGARGGGTGKQLAVAAGEVHHDRAIGGQRPCEGIGPGGWGEPCGLAFEDGVGGGVQHGLQVGGRNAGVAAATTTLRRSNNGGGLAGVDCDAHFKWLGNGLSERTENFGKLFVEMLAVGKRRNQHSIRQISIVIVTLMKTTTLMFVFLIAFHNALASQVGIAGKVSGYGILKFRRTSTLKANRNHQQV